MSGHARSRWPGLDEVTVRVRGQFAHFDAHLPVGEVMALCRLRYGGSANNSRSLAGRDGEDSIRPTGHTAGSPKWSSTALRALPQRPHSIDRSNTDQIAAGIGARVG